MNNLKNKNDEIYIYDITQKDIVKKPSFFSRIYKIKEVVQEKGKEFISIDKADLHKQCKKCKSIKTKYLFKKRGNMDEENVEVYRCTECDCIFCKKELV